MRNLRGRSFTAVTETTASRCSCGNLLEMAFPSPSSDRAAVPEPGDVTICFACAKPYVFTEGLGVVPAKLSTLSKEHRCWVEEAQAQVRAFRKSHPRKVVS